MVIRNAVVKSVSLSREDHGCMSVWLHLDYGGAGQGFGGYALDGPWNAETKKRNPNRALGLFVARVLDVCGVDSWERVAGCSVRVKSDHSKVYALGHFLKDEWFCPSEELSNDRD